MNTELDRREGKKRLAFLIGNAEYECERNVACSVDSVLQFSIVLNELNFGCLMLIDGNKSIIENSFTWFLQMVNDGDTVLIYYAGHGAQSL
ncbi:unnamed protein product, partial [Didymodactylos carnosus]